MLYRKAPTEFERRWLERIERRSVRQFESKRLRRLPYQRRLYRLGMIGLGLSFALLTGMVVFIVLVLLLHLLLLI